MEVDSPPATRLGARREAGPSDSPHGPTHTAIQAMEGFLKGRGLLGQIENAWKHVKNAALKGAEPDGGRDASDTPTQTQDIQDIKTSLAELARTVKDLKDQGLKKLSYAEVARSHSHSHKAQRANLRILPVPKRHYQESLIKTTAASQESFHEREWVKKAN